MLAFESRAKDAEAKASVAEKMSAGLKKMLDDTEAELQRFRKKREVIFSVFRIRARILIRSNDKSVY